MNDTEFASIINDRNLRRANYDTMIPAYYRRVTDTYRKSWSNSFHFAVFQGEEPLEEALVATERWIAELGGFKPGQRILDVGCGVGGPALNIAEHSGAHVTGLNISEYQVGICRECARERGLAERTHFQLGDAMTMPFADETFDAVYVFEVACHMPDKARFYRECARVLKRGGPFLGLEWLQRDEITRDEETKWIEPICRLHSVPDLGSPASTRGWMEAAGLHVQVVQSANAYGNFLKNWELLDEKTIEGIRGLPAEGIDPVLRMLTDGGIALAEAGRAGAFMIAHFRARKPA